jgi:hypothetical protein
LLVMLQIITIYYRPLLLRTGAVYYGSPPPKLTTKDPHTHVFISHMVVGIYRSPNIGA